MLHEVLQLSACLKGWCRPLRLSELAKKVDMEKEYKAFFKLYSKYVHPSSWIIIGAEEEINGSMYRDTFLLQLQVYASMILQKVTEETGVSH
ncbi:MAG: DUF5677 domain-containing protein [bacterium]